MNHSEHGFSLVELAVALLIMAVTGAAATSTTFQIINSTRISNSHITTVRQVQNAGYWIGRDASMAESIFTDNLSGDNFVLLTWTEWEQSGEEIYHSVTYFFDGLSGGVGKLKRSHWSSAGLNSETLIAEHIYYDPDDPAGTSKASYQNPELTVQLTALFQNDTEKREYVVGRRPNL